jgi:hypothetical protein
MGDLNRGSQRQGQVDPKTCELDELLRRPSLGLSAGSELLDYTLPPTFGDSNLNVCAS